MDLFDTIPEFSLPAEDRGACCKILAHLAHADLDVGLGERHFVEGLAARWELSDGEKAEVAHLLEHGESQADLDKHLASLRNRRSALVLLEKMMLLAQTDGRLRSEEKAIIAEVAARLEVPQATIEALERWVSDGLAWLHRGRQLAANF